MWIHVGQLWQPDWVKLKEKMLLILIKEVVEKKKNVKIFGENFALKGSKENGGMPGGRYRS